MSVTAFIDFMRSQGLAPARDSDIRETGKGKWVDFQLSDDARGKKKGYYTLTIDGDYTSGAVGDRRFGEKPVQFSAKPDRKFTDAERQAWAKKRDEDRKSAEKQRKEGWEQAAEKAKRNWKNAKPGAHPYLTKKGASGEGTRVLNGNLLLPMYADKRMYGVQSIDADGNKLFLSRGRKQGCFCPLTTAEEDKAIIAIGTGYATCDTVRQAMGWPVLVAFDDGNLTYVADAMRKKYPHSQIFIIADNDQWKFDQSKTPVDENGEKIKADDIAGDDPRWSVWDEEGCTRNSGVIHGKKVADEVNGVCILIDEPRLDAMKKTDWNDIKKAYGIDYVRAKLTAALEKPKQEMSAGDPTGSMDEHEWQAYLDSIPPLESYTEEARAEVALYANESADAYDPEWKTKLSFDDEGKLRSKSMVNVQLFLEYDEKLSKLFCYDEFSHEKILVQCPPWEKPEKFKPRPITDEDVTWLCVGLEKFGLTLGMMQVKKILDAVVMRKRRNPAQEYMKSLVWDGVPRLKTWLSYYAGAESEPLEYLEAVGTKWMVAAVARIFHPGRKFDHMLILEGDQGVGKSTLLRELGTIHGKEYFDDTIRANELGTAAVIPKMQGVMIVEIAELAGLRKAEMDTFKQQITIQEDRLVKKYSNEPTRFPRQFVLAGTFNMVQGYMDDPTGNRRLWPVKVGRKIDIAALRNDKAQLWAEAVHMFRDGCDLYLTPEITKHLEKVQGSRKIIHPWMPDLEKLSNGKSFISRDDIWDSLKIEKAKRTQVASNDIAKIMVELGYEQGRHQYSGNREYGWLIKESLV